MADISKHECKHGVFKKLRCEACETNKRVKKLRGNNAAQSRKRWEVSVTETEKAELKTKLAELRKSDSI